MRHSPPCAEEVSLLAQNRSARNCFYPGQLVLGTWCRRVMLVSSIPPVPWSKLDPGTRREVGTCDPLMSKPRHALCRMRRNVKAHAPDGSPPKRWEPPCTEEVRQNNCFEPRQLFLGTGCRRVLLSLPSLPCPGQNMTLERGGRKGELVLSCMTETCVVFRHRGAWDLAGCVGLPWG